LVPAPLPEATTQDDVPWRERVSGWVLGVLFFAWLYGAPFLLVIGVGRRTTPADFKTYAQAQAYGSTTDMIIASGIALTGLLPTVGLLVSRLVRQRRWLRTFGWSIVGVVIIYVAMAAISSAATAPLYNVVPGNVPASPGPTSTHCSVTSGGIDRCPGG
jgi:hypothetical protein